MSGAIRNAGIAQIIGLIAGAGVAAATGSGSAAEAGIAAGQSFAQGDFLTFSQGQEGAADKAATVFLEDTHQSARGLLQFMQKIQEQEAGLGIHEVPYLQTHPLTQSRIDFLQHVLAVSKYSNAPEPAAYKEEHARMVAKLAGFLWPPERVFEKYPASDTSIAARYARAVAYHRMDNETEALKLIDGLIAQEPRDPFFRELKGQILFEAGRVAEAVGPYERANQLLPGNSLIETEMAQTMVETGDPRFNPKALAALNDAAVKDPDNSLTWRLLAAIDGREGKENQAMLYSAEEAYADGRYADAKGQAQYVEKRLPFGSPDAIRAQDLEQAARDALKASE